MREIAELFSRFAPRVPTGFKYMAVGHLLPDLEQALDRQGIKGIGIREPHATTHFTAETEIRGTLTENYSLAQQAGQSYLEPALPLFSVFTAYAGPFGVFLIDYEARTRMVYYSPQVMASVPFIIVMPEDGHNEEVRKSASVRDYQCVTTDDGYWLLMVHRSRRK